MVPMVAGISTGLLGPVVALNIWTFTMEAWMYATRIAAISKYNVQLGPNATKDGTFAYSIRVILLFVKSLVQ
jgi:hypothetical protein